MGGTGGRYYAHSISVDFSLNRSEVGPWRDHVSRS